MKDNWFLMRAPASGSQTNNKECVGNVNVYNSIDSKMLFSVKKTAFCRVGHFKFIGI